MNPPATDHASNAILFWIDPEGRILDASDGACRALGYDRETLSTLSVRDVDAEFPRDRWPDHWRELRQAKTLHFRTTHRRRDGSLAPVEVTAHHVELAGREHICALVREITPQRLTEIALRESEERLALALAVSGQGLYDLDIATGQAVFSDEYARMLGYEPSELVLTPAVWATWLHPEERERLLRLFEDCVTGKQSDYRAEFRLRARSGEWIWVLSAGKVVQWDAAGRPLRMVGTHLDITERKAAETRLRHHLDLEQALAEISALMIEPGWDDFDARVAWTLERIGRLTGADRSCLFAIAPDGSTATNTHEWCAQGVHPPIQEAQNLPVADYRPFHDWLRRGEAVSVQTAAVPDAAALKALLLAGDVRSLLCVPMQWGGTLRGFIGLEAVTTERTWREEDIRLLRMVAEIVAHTRQHIESERILRDNARFLENLDRISRILARRERDADLLAELAAATLDIFQADRAFFLHPGDPDAARFHIRIEATRPEWPGVFASGADITPDGVEIVPDDAFRRDLRRTLRHQGPVLSDFAGLSEAPNLARRGGVRSQMTIALRPQLGPPWVLGVHQCAYDRRWTDAEQRLFQAIAERVSDALSGHLLLKQLQESEQRYRTVFENAHDAIIVHDFQGAIQAVNQTMLTLYGLDYEEVLKVTIADLSGPDNPSNPADDHWPRIARGETLRFEWNARRPKDGSCFPVEVMLGAIRFGGENCILSSVRDITEQKRAEQALQESERRYRTIFETAAVSIWEEDISAVKAAIDELKAQGIQNVRDYLEQYPAFVVDCAQRIRVIDVNQQTLKLFGARNKEELLGALTKVFLPETLLAFKETLVAIAERKHYFEIETVNQTLRGERRNMLLTAAFPEQDASFINVLVSMIDITERKRAEEALQKNANEMQWLMKSMANAFVMWESVFDADGQFINFRFAYFNDAYEKVSGLKLEEVQGKTVLEVWPETEQSWFDVFGEVAITGNPKYFEMYHAPTRGLYACNAYRPWDTPDRICVVFEDVTERRRAEAELQRHREHLEELVAERTAELRQAMNQLVQAEKLAALGQLVAGVAHELNTPLGNARVVAGALGAHLREFAAAVGDGALRRSQVDAFLERGREAVDLLERNTARAADLIGQFKQVAVDQTSMRRRRFDLRRTVEELLATLQPQFKRTAHRIELDIPPDLELDSYPGPLEQVLANLIANSLIHGFAGIETGRIQLQAQTIDPTQVVLRYADNGVGIPTATLKRIFEPFFTARLGQGGSGLGLYIVYNLVTNVLGGTIQVDGALGHGTTFTLALPRTAPDQPASD